MRRRLLLVLLLFARKSASVCRSLSLDMVALVPFLLLLLLLLLLLQTVRSPSSSSAVSTTYSLSPSSCTNT
jgi:hypothetical protein